MTSRPVPTFFEPGAPPPIIPLPTCQTNLLLYADTLGTTIWREEVCRPSRKAKQTASTTRSVNRARDSSPYPRSIVTIPGDGTSVHEAHTSRLVNRHPSPISDLTDSEASSTGSTGEGPSEVDELIPKPPGDVARPNRGGYNLAKALGWPNEKFEKLRVCFTPELPSAT